MPAAAFNALAPATWAEPAVVRAEAVAAGGAPRLACLSSPLQIADLERLLEPGTSVRAAGGLAARLRPRR